MSPSHRHFVATSVTDPRVATLNRSKKEPPKEIVRRLIGARGTGIVFLNGVRLSRVLTSGTASLPTSTSRIRNRSLCKHVDEIKEAG